MLYLLRILKLTVILSLLFVVPSYAATKLEDEGVNKGYVNELNFTGAGVTASRSGIKGVIDVSGGAETNSLETVCTGIATTEIPIGTAADTVVYAALSGEATMANNGVVTLADSVAVTSWNLTTPTITTSLTTSTPTTLSVAELDILDGGIEGTEILSTGEGGGTKFLREDGDNTCSWQTPAGGASEININLLPQGAKLPTSAFALIDAGNSGWRLLFDDTTQEFGAWEFVLDDDYGAGTLYADVYFSMASGEANEVQFEGYVMAYTPGTDTADIDTDSYDTVNEGTATTVAATAGREYKQTITLTNADSAAAGDHIRFKLSTDSDDATNDDATGDREVRLIVIRE